MSRGREERRRKRGEEEEERRGGGREERRRVVIVNIACPNVVLCEVNERSNLLRSLGQHYQTISKRSKVKSTWLSRPCIRLSVK